MAPITSFSNSPPYRQHHTRSEDAQNSGDISGLLLTAIGVLLTAISVFGSWKCWQRRKNRVQPLPNQGPSEVDSSSIQIPPAPIPAALPPLLEPPVPTGPAPPVLASPTQTPTAPMPTVPTPLWLTPQLLTHSAQSAINTQFQLLSSFSFHAYGAVGIPVLRGPTELSVPPAVQLQILRPLPVPSASTLVASRRELLYPPSSPSRVATL